MATVPTIGHAPTEAQTRWALVLIRARGKGWSQNRLARRLRVSPGYLSRVIRAERTGYKLLPKAERLVST